MDRKKLTDRTLKALRPPDPDVMDSVVRELGVRVLGTADSPVLTFVLITRYPGSKNPTRRALGRYGELTLEKARDKARRHLELIHKGVDPKVEEERTRLEAQRRQENSFRVVAEEFIRRALPGQRKAAIVERELRREFVDRWGGRPITDITKHDVVAVLDAAVDRDAPYQAHNLLGHVRRLFGWAIGRGIYGIESSPCDRLRPADVIGKKALRTRTLDNDELRAFWRAGGRLGYPFGPMFRLLAVTGQRKSEVSDARWSEFDLDKALWTIPAERMKADAVHVVPLTDEAIAILKGLPRFKRGDHLFSTTFGEKPVSGFSKAKARLDQQTLRSWLAIGRAKGEDRRDKTLEPWVVHDIRRTMRTHLSALPVPDMVRELVIAHTKPGLHRVYDQHAYLDEKRHALTLWAQRLKGIVEPPPSNVSKLSEHRKKSA
jgi:integrase